MAGYNEETLENYPRIYEISAANIIEISLTTLYLYESAGRLIYPLLTNARDGRGRLPAIPQIQQVLGLLTPFEYVDLSNLSISDILGGYYTIDDTVQGRTVDYREYSFRRVTLPEGSRFSHEDFQYSAWRDWSSPTRDGDILYVRVKGESFLFVDIGNGRLFGWERGWLGPIRLYSVIPVQPSGL